MSRLTRDREVAARLLLRQAREQGRLDVWMRSESRGLPEAGRRRVQALVYGINRQRSLLAAWLDPLLKRPLARQDEPVRIALELGSYELLFQDSVPDRAAVDQAVRLVRRLGQGGRAGLVNAVLRNMARQERPPELPDRVADPLGWAEVIASHPRWLIDEMAALMSEARVADLAEAANREAPLAIALRDVDDDDVVQALDGERSPAVPGAVLLRNRPKGSVEALPGFDEGRWWVQDVGAQAVAAMLGVGEGATVLDACAAPGGKTLAAAVRVGPTGRVVAVDRSARRLRMLERSLERLGLDGVEILERDLLAAPWDGPTFDAVLLDAPCSGLGVLRRHPEIRWSRGPGDPKHQAARQRSLMLRVADAVAPGGVLVYSVCTFTRVETLEVLEDFLGRRADFRIDPPQLDPSLLDGPYLRTRPDLHDADAFFAVRLVRSETTP